MSASPALRDPVKPTAATAGCVTSSVPTVGPSAKTMENIPAGNPLAATALLTAAAMISEVPG